MTHSERVAVFFECVTVCDKSAEIMFDLARSIDVHVGSQTTASETAVAGVTTGLIGLGEDVTWRARHFGIPFRMTSRVTEFHRPHRFVDEQTRGPFAKFHHEHIFEATTSGSVMTDRVHLIAPFGPLGRIAEKLLLSPYLQRLIQARGRYLADLST